jgi:8-oxo-dGTP pyrophosphatase MutT (NUDIX family)
MLKRLVDYYLRQNPDDKDSLELLLRQIADRENLADRTNYRGHVTSSSLIFSPDNKKILLIYHPTFERWMQPGGHWDKGEAGPWLASRREAVEETGVQIAKQLFLANKKLPILIETHPIPSKPPKNEPDHYHHSFWYSFIAASEKLSLNDQVIKRAAWKPIRQIDDQIIIKAIARSQKMLKA